MGSPDPELPDTTLFVTVFPEIFKPIFRVYLNKSDLQAGISELQGERVKKNVTNFISLLYTS